MRIKDLILFSIDNLRRRKGRTVLTIIGVVVGVCAIVVMVSLGVAVNQSTDEMLKNWGDLTKIEISNYGAQQGTADLDEKMVEKFRRLPGVLAATPVVQPQGFYGNVTAGTNNRYEGWAQVVGMDIAAIQPMGYQLVTGSYDLPAGLGGNRIPVLVGEQVPFSFRDTRKSMNSPNAMKYPQYSEDYMTITNLPRYDEAGVLLNPEDFFFDIMHTKLTYRMVVGYDETSGENSYKDYELVPVGMLSGGMSDWMVSNGIVMGIASVEKLEADYKKATGSGSGGGGGGGGGMIVGRGVAVNVSGTGGPGGNTTVGGYSQVFVKARSVEDMDEVEKAIKQEGYQIYSITETRRQMQGQVAQTQMMLGGLAAVSLFVAALNIMNTMTMAITERRREIGVMKVLGCEIKNIRRMFLIESGAIGLIGGVTGVVLSVVLSLLLNNLGMIMAALGLDAATIDIGSFFGMGGMISQGTSNALSIIPAWLIIFALAFATLVGLLSGIGPANSAVRISSLEAIRHE